MNLTEEQQKRLENGLHAAFAVPFIDDVEDFVWEVIFSYALGIDVVDPFTNIRSKKLFDVIEKKTRTGWSCKALQWRVAERVEFELVIQRADIFKKCKSLGFDELSIDSPEADLGAALLKHWHDKIEADAKTQGADNMRISVLLKNDARSRFAYYEDQLTLYKPGDIAWAWTDSSKTGLQGKRKSDEFCIFRWYPNQKQLFERFQLPEGCKPFSLTPRRLKVQDTVQMLLEALAKKPSEVVKEYPEDSSLLL